MSKNTHAYYERRCAQERKLAAAAVDPMIAAIHMELAAYYEILATGRPVNDNPDRAPITD